MRSSVLRAFSILLTGPLFAASGTVVSQNSSVVSLFLEGGKFQFAPGEAIPAKTTVLGNYSYSRAVIVPATLAHGDWKLAQENSLDTRYLYEAGSISFRAPSKEGQYQIRVFTGYNPTLEGAVVPISVKAGEKEGEVSDHVLPEISLEMTRSWIIPGESMKVKYTLPKNGVDGAWIGLFPEGSSDEKFLTRSYIHKTGSNSVTIKAPAKPDQYLLKLFKSSDSEALASFEFKVAK